MEHLVQQCAVARVEYNVALGAKHSSRRRRGDFVHEWVKRVELIQGKLEACLELGVLQGACATVGKELDQQRNGEEWRREQREKHLCLLLFERRFCKKRELLRRFVDHLLCDDVVALLLQRRHGRFCSLSRLFNAISLRDPRLEALTRLAL